MMRFGKKVLSVILCLIMVFGTIAIGSEGFADLVELLSTKVHAVNSEFAGGTGTDDDPYLISTPEQLDSVRNYLNSSFVLINDIDLIGFERWIPIGTTSSLYSDYSEEDGLTIINNPFMGTFDGAGYKIYNLSLDEKSVSFGNDTYGLFGSIKGALLKNIHLIGINYSINSSESNVYYSTPNIYIGGIAGYATSGAYLEETQTYKEAQIINCSCSGLISLNNPYQYYDRGDYIIGGINGGIYCYIENCDNFTDISIKVDSGEHGVECGGITGNNGHIKKCFNAGNIKSISDHGAYSGGISGTHSKIENCINIANVDVESTGSIASSRGSVCAGGICGYSSNCKYCVNYGDVSAKNITKHNLSSYYCSLPNNCFAGGIVGYSPSFQGEISLSNCVNFSSNVSSYELNDKNNVVSGAVGRIAGYSTYGYQDNYTESCYSSTTTKINSETVSGTANDNNGGDVPADANILESTYPQFDFSETWMIDDSVGAVLKRYNYIVNNYSLNNAPPYWGDLNGDYAVDQTDIISIANKIFNKKLEPTQEQLCFMDVNLNGTVFGEDEELVVEGTDNENCDRNLMNAFRIGSITKLPACSLAKYEFVPPTKTTYSVGEAFDPSGMKIIVTNKENPSVRYELTENIEVPDFDLSSEGSKTVTASFRGLNYTFNVNIINADVDEDEEIIIRGKFEGYYTATSQSNTGKKYASPVIIDGTEYPTQEMLISLSKADGYKGKKVAILVKGGKIIDIIEDVYDLKDETYRFKNFGYDTNKDSFCKPKHNHGHCFGMSVTSSAYYLGLLNRTDIIGGKDYEPLYSFLCSQGVREPICHYQCIQGKTVKNAMVAGGYVDKHLNGVLINPSGDWRACVDYVKNHNYDNEGSLTVGVWFDYEDRGIVEGTWVDVINYSAHELNFLYYKEVDGEQRIYVYDSNAPEFEQYLYWGEDNRIHEKRFFIENNKKIDDDHIIVGMDLMDVKKYFDEAEKFKSSNTVYGDVSEISVSNSEVGFLRGEQESGGYVMFEVPDGTKEVVITPLVDYAEFEYMDKTYTFGKIDDNTYGVLTLATSDSAPENVEFEIKDAPNSSLTEAIIYVKSDEVYKNSKVSVKAKAAGVPDGYVLAVYDGGKPVATGTNTFVTYEIPNLVVSDKKLEVKIIDKDGNVQKDKSGKDLSENIEIKVKPGFFNMIIAFFKKLFGSNKVTIEP